ncbi:MAG: alpha/beta hydrolase-fold protein [Anaerolineae bacterium]|jgi:esterase/lipase superfamily enzyme
MKTEYHKWWSSALGHDMELKVYGDAGKSAVVFPSAGGKFYEFEDFGMVEACRPFIEEGKLRLFTVDSIDHQSWLNFSAHPADRGRRHSDYDRYIMEEVAPFIRNQQGTTAKCLATGCSLGAYHAANFFFRHPDLFDTVIALSGMYSLRFSVGDYSDDNIFYNSPLSYLPGLEDPWYLDHYRQSQIILCSGQGAWEDGLEEAIAVKGVLDAKEVPCWLDLWGYDVNHDWPWWQRQLPYFLGYLELPESQPAG